MKITVNGETKELEQDALSVHQLFSALHVENPEMVSVEVDGTIVARDAFDDPIVRDGSAVEFIYFMGGGAVDFSEEQIERYSRHFILAELGGAGQATLLESRVLVIGAGGLGSSALLYLAAAGVGTLGIADFDAVELSNLQRQIIHRTAAVGAPKVESAQAAIAALNPDVRVELHPTYVDHTNAVDLVSRYDVVVDAVDGIAAKFLINDACVLANKPFVHAGALQFQGQIFSHTPGNACLRCLFPQVPPPDAVPTCAAAGILGPQVGLLGVWQAIEVIKILTGVGTPLLNRGLAVDGKAGKVKEFAFARRSTCPLCGDAPTITAPEPIAAPTCRVAV